MDSEIHAVRLGLSSVDDVELPCRAPGYRIVVQLVNGETEPQIFKCKTSAPRRWSVRPNSGVLDPGESVDVTFKLAAQSEEAANAAKVDPDRHLIVSSVVRVEVAEGLRTQRKQHPPTFDAPMLDSPGASQLRVSPIFSAPLPIRSFPPATRTPAVQIPVPVGTMNGAAPSDAESYGSVGAPLPLAGATPNGNPPMLTPLSSPMPPSPAPPKSAPRTAPTPFQKQASVAERVAELNRRNSDSPTRLASDVAMLDPAAPPGGGPSAEDSDDEDGRGARKGGLANYLLSLLHRGADEFVPWLSWKVFDVLFALLMLKLARRSRLIRDAQEAGIL